MLFVLHICIYIYIYIYIYMTQAIIKKYNFHSKLNYSQKDLKSQIELHDPP